MIIGTPTNDDPVDVIVRYRDLNVSPTDFKMGWNIFSRRSLEGWAKKVIPNCHTRWVDFRMPFEIAKGTDPMRTWTIPTAENQYQTINGACQLIHLNLLEVSVPKH